MRLFNIFFFGDSICVGQYVSIHNGWVTKISAKLSEFGETHNLQIIVTNASANGRTTRQALEIINYEVLSSSPDILIVQFGMNDCNYWKTEKGFPRVSHKSFEANLEEIILRALNHGVKKIVVNTNHPTGKDYEYLPFTNITYQQSNKKYNQLIRKTVNQFDSHVHLIDIEKIFYDYINGDQNRLLDLLLSPSDLLHISEKGHELYYRNIYPVLEEIILDSIN